MEAIQTYPMTVHLVSGRTIEVDEGFIREGGVYDLAEDGWVFYPLQQVKFIERHFSETQRLTREA